jgi:hypothetical protein
MCDKVNRERVGWNKESWKEFLTGIKMAQNVKILFALNYLFVNHNCFQELVCNNEGETKNCAIYTLGQ